MKKQEGYEVKSREIDLKRMLWWIARQWRKLLILAVLCACVMCAWRYHKDAQANRKAYEAALAEREKEETSMEEVEAVLNDDQIRGVEWALYYYTRAREAEDYLENSLLMKANPYAMDIMYIYYRADDVSNAKVKLEQFLMNEAFLEDLKEKLNWETEAHYLLELFEVEEDGEQIIISIKADSQSNCTAIADNTISLIEEYFDEAVEEINHILGVTTDLDLVTTYINILDQKNTYHSLFVSYQNNFIVAQDMLFGMKLTELDGTVSEEETKEEVVIELAETHINKTTLVLGAIAGVIVGIVVFAVWYTFSTNIHGVAEMKYLFALPSMGNVNITGLKKKKLLSGFDKILNRAAYGKDAALSYEQQVEMIASNIYIACKNQNLKEVFVSGSEMKYVPEAFVTDVKTALEKKNIVLIAGKCISYDAETLLKAEEVGNILFIETDEVSKCDEIAKELNLCIQNNIQSLGIIMVQY